MNTSGVAEAVFAPVGIISLLLLCLIAYLVYKIAYAPFQVFKGTGIKGPTPVPFFGNYRERSRLGVLKYCEKLHQEYGHVVGYYLGQKPGVYVTDLEILKHVMVKDFEAFMDRPPFPIVLPKEISGGGLLAARGDKWRESRQILSPAFSTSKLKMMVPLIKRSTEALAEQFGEKAKNGESFNVLKLYGSFTMETILAIAFGRVIDLQRGESDQLTEAARAMFRGGEEGKSTSLAPILLILSNFPWLKSVISFFFVRSEVGKLFFLLYSTAATLVKARRETGHPGRYKDLLQLMINASGEEEGEESLEDGSHKEKYIEDKTGCLMQAEERSHTNKRKLTDHEIVDHSVNFLLAGYETTSNALAYTSYLLALNPEIQEKLQREIDDYFEENPDCSLYDAAQEIEYLDMVLQESLRIYPPSPFIARYTTRAITVNGVTFPKNVTVNVPVFLLHKNPQYWKEPDKFSPERFTAEEKAKRPQLSHLPFGFGPRNCIGMRFALLEAKMALIELLKKYTFVRAPDTEVPLQVAIGITMSPKHGIFLKVVDRH